MIYRVADNKVIIYLIVDGLRDMQTVLGGTHTQSLLDLVIEVADGDAGHGGAPALIEGEASGEPRRFDPVAYKQRMLSAYG